MQLNKCDFNTGLYLENNLIFQKKVTRFHFYHLRLSCKGDGDDEDVESPFRALMMKGVMAALSGGAQEMV